jgi:hypothetical protein
MSVVLVDANEGAAALVKPSPDRSTSRWSGESAAMMARACAIVHGCW